jgi:hypothetical protein
MRPQHRVGSSRLTRATAPRRTLIVVAISCLAVLLAACGSGTASDTSPPLHRTPFDPANFVDPTTSTNPFQPLRPGMQWVREGTTEVGSRAVPHQVITTMTDVIRTIDGIPTVAMIDQDTDSGQVAQLSIDYFGLDKAGNVWLVGGYTEAFSGGEFTNTIDAWLGKGPGSEPGILMPAKPKVSTPRWFVQSNSGDGGSAAEVVDVGASRCVAFSCYKNVLVVREGKIKAIDNEFKFYAPDVGQIRNSPRKDSKHNDVEELVNLVQLSPTGLAEMSAEVLRLEAHARTTEPDIFGAAPESTRAQ